MNTTDVKVGNLVMMKETTAPSGLYGLGLVIEKLQLCNTNKNAVKVFVRWAGGMGTLPRIGQCHPSCLEVLA